jgi:AraC family transcriptional regulator of adaptative response / methylphosphotriester-DNA alkyltransferase methyltransferase
MEAMKAGFRPCKKCRPDKEVFEPEWELVSKAKIIFDKEYDSVTDMNSTAKQLGVSTNYLTRLFKKQLGLTPTQYIAGLRINKAGELLEHTEKDILEIAYMTGFKSLSSFYKCFREKTGHTPKEHRRTGGSKNADTLL